MAITVIAIGTSLPELVTTITAIVKKQNELSFGNIIGANIFDITLILPVSAMLSKGGRLTIERSAVFVDIPVMLLCGTVALAPMLASGRFKRWQGFALIGIYLVYIILMCFGVISV